MSGGARKGRPRVRFFRGRARLERLRSEKPIRHKRWRPGKYEIEIIDNSQLTKRGRKKRRSGLQLTGWTVVCSSCDFERHVPTWAEAEKVRNDHKKRRHPSTTAIAQTVKEFASGSKDRALDAWRKKSADG